MDGAGGLPPRGIGPAAGPGGPQPHGEPQPAPPGSDRTAQSFKAHLEAKLAARRARQAIPDGHVQEIIRFFNRRGEAFESVRLVTKYPPIEKDDALYEVCTDQGTHRVIRARDGSYTVFE
jgi:hypothetical protein